MGNGLIALLISKRIVASIGILEKSLFQEEANADSNMRSALIYMLIYKFFKFLPVLSLAHIFLFNNKSGINVPRWNHAGQWFPEAKEMLLKAFLKASTAAYVPLKTMSGKI